MACINSKKVRDTTTGAYSLLTGLLKPNHMDDLEITLSGCPWQSRVKTLHSQCREHGFDTWSGILHAMLQPKNENLLAKQQVEKPHVTQGPEQLEGKTFASKHLICYCTQPCYLRWGSANLESLYPCSCPNQLPMLTNTDIHFKDKQSTKTIKHLKTAITKINFMTPTLKYWTSSIGAWSEKVMESRKMVGKWMKWKSTGECLLCCILIQWKYYIHVKINELDLHDELMNLTNSEDQRVMRNTQQYYLYEV